MVFFFYNLFVNLFLLLLPFPNYTTTSVHHILYKTNSLLFFVIYTYTYIYLQWCWAALLLKHHTFIILWKPKILSILPCILFCAYLPYKYYMYACAIYFFLFFLLCIARNPFQIKQNRKKERNEASKKPRRTERVFFCSYECSFCVL